MRRNAIPPLAFLLVAVFLFSPWISHSTAQPHRKPRFDPRDLNGVWWVEEPGSGKLMARGSKGDASKCQTCHLPEHTQPEPPLTAWAVENLLNKGIPVGNMMGGGNSTGAGADGSHAMAATKPNCDPIGVPAQFWHTQLSPFELVAARGRIFQFFEAHHEWRTIWLNRDHPRDLELTYMGDSTGRWEGNTLVVDTIGFNGKTLIEPVGVGHRMSDAFHLVERWRRVDASTLELDATYYDPKVWGDKPWGGLKKIFKLQSGMRLIESICTEGDNAIFEENVIKPAASQ
ncbi:MAG TPA: hypothetical protein VG892_10415 [Terriglobales bacterium]|nr:hypothetical protein [Terriglobales bacterium]